MLVSTVAGSTRPGAASATRLGQPAGARVVVGQPVDVVVERVQPGRREDADLAHPAAEPLAPDARLGDRARADDASTEPTGAPEALGQADRHGVEQLAVRRQRRRRSRRARSTAGRRRGAARTPASRGDLAQPARGRRAAAPCRRRSCACSRRRPRPSTRSTARRPGASAPRRASTSTRPRCAAQVRVVMPDDGGRGTELGPHDVRVGRRRAAPGRARRAAGRRAGWPSSRSG